MKLKFEYNCILGGQVNNLILKLRQKLFKMGDRPSVLLPRQPSGTRASRSIHCIRSRAGTLLTNSKVQVMIILKSFTVNSTLLNVASTTQDLNDEL